MKYNGFKVKLLSVHLILMIIGLMEAEEMSRKSQRVIVSVYYEALCHDSVNFVTTQLVPAYNKLEDYIELELIPYGKAETAETNDGYTFRCHHGEAECAANIIHACVISKVRGSKRSLEVIDCMINSHIDPVLIFEQCAKDLEEFKKILSCSQSAEGRELLAMHGKVTDSLRPKISWVPTVTLDHSLDDQTLILTNLLERVCLRLEKPPSQCSRA